MQMLIKVHIVESMWFSSTSWPYTKKDKPLLLGTPYSCKVSRCLKGIQIMIINIIVFLRYMYNLYYHHKWLMPHYQ